MKCYVVDAFAQKVFEGNPAAVCITDTWLDDTLMQNIAMENNLSETAFAVKEEKGYGLRWFTPGGEIDLCGHATLATGFVIMNYLEPQVKKVSFFTQSGELIVERKENLYAMDFPVMEIKEYPILKEVGEALGVEPLACYLGRDLLCLLKTEEQVRNLNPDMGKLEQLPVGKGVYVTAKGKEYDFVSRSFFPKLNVNEDPVCGSMHCALVPFWAEKLQKTEFVAWQASKRGGELICSYKNGRVQLAGEAVLYAEKEIYI